MGYPSFVEKMSKGNDQEEGETETEAQIGSGGQTPHERIDAAMAELMIDRNIGVSEEQIYKIKRVDSDYFDSENV